MQTIAYKTLDLIDAIENRGLEVTHIEGHVGCIIPRGSDLEGLPKTTCCVQYFPQEGSYKVWWPDHPWTELVQDYLDIIHDESGAEGAGGVAKATGE